MYDRESKTQDKARHELKDYMEGLCWLRHFCAWWACSAFESAETILVLLEGMWD